MQPPVTYYPPEKFIPHNLTKKIIKLLSKIEFERSYRHIYGKLSASKVEYAWVSDTGLEYKFGRMTHGLKCHSFDEYPILQCIRQYVEVITGKEFNSVLVNKYVDGTISLGYHHDNDAWLGKNFIVPSISFGAERKLYVKSKDKSDKRLFKYTMESGSLLIMQEGMQEDWLHSVPADKKVNEVRYNLTFRNVVDY